MANKSKAKEREKEDQTMFASLRLVVMPQRDVAIKAKIVRRGLIEKDSLT